MEYKLTAAHKDGDGFDCGTETLYSGSSLAAAKAIIAGELAICFAHSGELVLSNVTAKLIKGRCPDRGYLFYITWVGGARATYYLRGIDSTIPKTYLSDIDAARLEALAEYDLRQNNNRFLIVYNPERKQVLIRVFAQGECIASTSAASVRDMRFVFDAFAPLQAIPAETFERYIAAFTAQGFRQ